MFNIKVGYPSAEEEEQILTDHDSRGNGDGQQGAVVARDLERAKTGRQRRGQSVRDSLRIAARCAPRGPATKRHPSMFVNWLIGEPDRGPVRT